MKEGKNELNKSISNIILIIFNIQIVLYCVNNFCKLGKKKLNFRLICLIGLKTKLFWFFLFWMGWFSWSILSKYMHKWDKNIICWWVPPKNLEPPFVGKLGEETKAIKGIREFQYCEANGEKSSATTERHQSFGLKGMSNRESKHSYTLKSTSNRKILRIDKK